MTAFQKGSGDWKEYRQLPELVEVDLHHSERGPRQIPYYEAMDEVWGRCHGAIRDAHEQGKKYVLFTHGWSTSRPGRTTARSQVRGLMRSKEATPYVDRKRCIQHESVFVAAIKPKR
jgi:hypothetical protein